MNCRQAEQLCSYSADLPLSPRQLRALQSHLHECAACRGREQMYRNFVSALRDRPADSRAGDLLQRALERVDAETGDALPAHKLPQWNIQFWKRLPRAQRVPANFGGRTTIFMLFSTRSAWSLLWKENTTMLRNASVTLIALIAVGATVMEMRPQPARGQAAFRKVQTAVAKSKTMHNVTWTFLLSEDEARNNTWHEGKTPVRLDTWLTRDAMRGADDVDGPYLWTEQGYLHYDRTARQVKIMDGRTEVSFKEAIASAFDPLSKIREAAPAGTYLSVKRLENTRWRDRSVYKLQIATGPNKPDPGEELPAVQEPGKTPPISQGPHVRETFWVDKNTDLPVYSEYEKPIQGRWIVTRRTEYDFDRPVPARLFDPRAVRKEAEAFGAARPKN